MMNGRGFPMMVVGGLAILLTVGCGGDEGTNPPLTGSIEASLAMTGAAPDVDGCRVAVGVAAAQVLLDGENHVFSDLSTGTHTMTITDVAFNCVVKGESSRAVSVASNDTTPVSFNLDCKEPGSIEVTTKTFGSAVDPDGYVAILRGVTSRDTGVGLSDSVTFSDLPAGEHHVELTGLADNCRVTNENPASATVAKTRVTRIHFDVVCPPFYDHIAFIREGWPGEIYVMRTDGSDLMNLTNSDFSEEALTWSPDGARIAFTGWVSSSKGIYVMDADGSNVEQLYSERYASSPAWSPDGTRIAFSAPALNAKPSDIYVMDADGSDIVNLTRHPANEGMPTWSPDGARIAFQRDWDIYVMDADGSNPINLTDNLSLESAPVWSPDGQSIAFMSLGVGNNWDIFVMDADGSNPINLTNDPAFDATGSWSPDGSRIAFTSTRDGGNRHIFAMDADGSNLVRLTDDDVFDTDPEWSPGQ